MERFIGKETDFQFNADLSGNIILTNDDGDKFSILGKDLVDFICWHRESYKDNYTAPAK